MHMCMVDSLVYTLVSKETTRLRVCAPKSGVVSAYAPAQVAIVQCIHISLVPDIECKSVLVCFIVYAHVHRR
jgi:hypothetical protein